ncbi:Helix-turn-helix domain-containing protein [Rhizobium sp. NFACC06-2]|nr:Helix-turn-helix domain-containing protein [Rhizobium sp. NFACC06-2]
MAAGTIAERMNLSPSNVSFHLKELDRAGLIFQRRESRSIVYTAGYDTLAELVTFLMKDCCAGHPTIRSSVEQRETCCQLPETNRQDGLGA